MPAYLEVKNGRQAGVRYSLDRAVTRIGRHPDCEVPLEGNAVSRFHAHIVREGAGYAIEDQKSRNQTYVNGKPVARVLLNDQDRVKICDTLFVFLAAAPADALDPLAMSTAENLTIEDDRPSTVLSTLAADSQSVFASSVKPEAKLRAILEISQAIAQTLELDLVFEKILDSLFRIFPQADRGMVIQSDAEGRLIPRAMRQRLEQDEPLRFSRTLVKRAMEERKGILSADAASDERFSMSESIADFRIRSVMCVPLVAPDQRPLGVIQIVAHSYHQRFSDEDLQVLVSVATQAAIAMENARLHEDALRQERMRRELAFAREVQHGFLPRTSPSVPGYEFWSYYEAAGEVGGDHYDFVPLPDGRQAVVVADVSGKGVPAALLMARVSSDAKVALVLHPDDPAKALTALNRTVCEAELYERFITLSASVLDPRTHRVRTASAGHMSPIVRRRDGSTVEPVTDHERSFALGVMPNAEYRCVEFELAQGESVVAYSDGISEAMNVQELQYSTARLRERIGALNSSAAEVGDAIVRDVRAFASGRPQHDDMTLVIFRRMA